MGRKRRPARHHGVLILDKPAGRTSHDVVQLVRKRLDERRVGHAGTLDPMATGVLVVLVGEATKLAPYLTAQNKRYRATIRFGQTTDSLDADGRIVDETPLPAHWRSSFSTQLQTGLAHERNRRQQLPPVVSAIKIDGQASHARVRAGEVVDLPPRPVRVHRLEGEVCGDASARLSLEVSKGYYVRALARDLGQALGVGAHLTALRREASGRFTLDDAVPLDEAFGPERLMPAAEGARRALAEVDLTLEGAAKARQGGPMRAEHFVAPPPLGLAAWLSNDALVAIGKRTSDNKIKVLRGFNTP